MGFTKRLKNAIALTIVTGALFLSTHFAVHSISESIHPTSAQPAGFIPMGAGPGGAIVPLGATPGVVTMTRSSPAPTTAYVSLRGPIRPDTVPQTWIPGGPQSTAPCPKKGDKSWHTMLTTSAPIVAFDCPVGVATKIVAGKTVRVNIAFTTELHPGRAATYGLVAPR